ncbi:MAG TPA: MFS transporter [Pirellulales bacterium]|jgi:MFS family permease
MSRLEAAAGDSAERPAGNAPPIVSHSGGTTFVRYLVLAWLCAAAMLAYAQRFQLGLGVKQMQLDLDLSDRQMGWAMGSFYIAYAALQIPGGRLAERLGSRAALALCVALCSFAAGATGGVVGFASLIAARAVTGGGQAGIFPGATASLARWFPSGERAIASGLLAGFMSLGAAGASYATGWLLTLTNWRWVFVIFALPGLLWSAGFWLWYRNRPEEHPSVGAEELVRIRGTASKFSNELHDVNEASDASDPEHVEDIPWIALLRSRAMWLIAWQQFFRAAGYALFATWFTKLLREVYLLSEQEALYWNAAPLLGVVVGSWLGGAASDWLLVRTGSRGVGRKMTAAVTMFGCAAMFALAMIPTSHVAAVAWITGASFLGAVAGPVAYAITIDMGGRHVPTVFSVMNMSGNIGAATFPIVVAYVVEWTGHWEHVLGLVVAIYVLGGVCWLLLNPNGTVFDSQAKA